MELTYNLGLIVAVGVFLLLVALIDWKRKKVPSVLTTSVILLLAIFNVALMPYALNFGILAFAFAWLLYEFNYISGVADLKCIAIIGLTISNFRQFFAMIVLVAIFGFIYQMALMIIKKKKHGEEIPFTPVFFLVYVALEILIWIT
jgi:prepilin signal peptidase PulO-like enzyme (type II secretory pathway)